MTSNAYLATDGEKLMKVGKANDISRREKQIALPITCTLACLDEDAAFRVERKLRAFVVKCGGIRHEATKDWFSFDPQIYKMLCEFASTLDGFEPVPAKPIKVETEADIDAEILKLRKRYIKLLEDELQAELDKVLAEKAELQAKSRRLEVEAQIIQQSSWIPISELYEKYAEKYPDVIHDLKQKDEALRAKNAEILRLEQEKADELARIRQQGDDEIRQVIAEKDRAIISILQDSFYIQASEHFRKFNNYLAPLHEEIGALRAELRFLQEKYGITE